jgi:UDP-glucose 4-epimerase
MDIKAPHREDVDFIQGSILSEEDIKKAMKDIEIVYHFGGFSNIDLVKNNPVETINLNILGTTYLLEACRCFGIKRFLFASSVYVYDERGHLYTTSKLASELLCKNYSTLYGLPYTILRIATVYGPRSRNADVISIFVQRGLKNENLVIHGSGSQKRNFIYVEDVAEASVLALTDMVQSKILVIANRESTTIKELGQLVLELTGTNAHIITKQYNEREDDYKGIIEKDLFTESILGWSPRVNLKEGIQKYINWLKKSNEVV